jgi:DNA-binding response OmpR family regulator
MLLMSKKILFVDDDKDWRSVVSTTLKGVGHDVLTARDATEAMAQAEGTDLGLIILDLDLAGESGLLLMKFLRKNHPGVPVVLYTGLDHDEETVKHMLMQGAHQYLKKGKMEELVAAVRRSFRG